MEKDDVFECPECEYTTSWTMQDVTEKGTPVCPDCDVDLTIEDYGKCGNCGRDATHNSGGINRFDRCNDF